MGMTRFTLIDFGFEVSAAQSRPIAWSTLDDIRAAFLKLPFAGPADSKYPRRHLPPKVIKNRKCRFFFIAVAGGKTGYAAAGLIAGTRNFFLRRPAPSELGRF